MKLNLDTIIIFVHNVEALKPFYVDIFGLALLEQQPGWALLAAGNAKIGLHQIGEKYLIESEAKSTAHKNTKLIFDIDADIHELRQSLIAQNVKMREVKNFENYGYTMCDGEDPEGNVFQLRQKK